MTWSNKRYMICVLVVLRFRVWNFRIQLTYCTKHSREIIETAYIHGCRYSCIHSLKHQQQHTWSAGCRSMSDWTVYISQHIQHTMKRLHSVVALDCIQGASMHQSYIDICCMNAIWVSEWPFPSGKGLSFGRWYLGMVPKNVVRKQFINKSWEWNHHVGLHDY